MYRKEKKIPTLLAIFLLFLGIGTTVYLDQSRKSLKISAKDNLPAEDVHFTNISDRSFTVSWLTSEPTIGSIVISKDNTKFTFLDDLDSDNIPRPRTSHFITAKNLKEDTTYSVQIISGAKSCKNGKNCPLFTQKTAKKLNSIIALPPAHGNIVTRQGAPAETAIVYLIIGKGLPLSGRVDSSGLWVIPLTNLRTGDFKKRPEISDSDIVQITAKLSPGETTTAVIDLKSIRQNLTIPNMTIGNSYNFIDLMAKKGLFAQNTNQNILGAEAKSSQYQKPKASSSSISSPKIDILFPKKDSDVTFDNNPRLRGIGPAGSQITITVNSTPQTGKVIVNSDGTWYWRPPKPLSPGIHYITIQGYDNNGNQITINRRFIVLKSGERVLGEATPSASLTPTLSPTASPTLVATPSATVTPLLPSPTPTLTITSPSPTQIAQIPTNTPIPSPRSGNIRPTLVLLGGSLSLFILGLKLFIFS